MKMNSGMMMSQSVKPPQAWSNCARTAFGSPNDLSSAYTNGPITVRRNMSAPLRMSSESSLFLAAAVLSFMPSVFIDSELYHISCAAGTAPPKVVMAQFARQF